MEGAHMKKAAFFTTQSEPIHIPVLLHDGPLVLFGQGLGSPLGPTPTAALLFITLIVLFEFWGV